MPNLRPKQEGEEEIKFIDFPKMTNNENKPQFTIVKGSNLFGKN